MNNAVDATIDNQALDQAGQALTEQSQHIMAVQDQCAVDLPYNLALYVARIKQHAAESAMRLIEIGRMLLVMRERETHEVFHATLEDIGISTRFCRRCMQAAVKLQDKPLLQKLGVSKALEFLAEDDSTLGELEQGGTLAGKTLDEFDTMTVRELKDALRAERKQRAAEKETSERIIARNEARINQLDRRAAELEPDQQRLSELSKAFVDAGGVANTALAEMQEFQSQIYALQRAAGVTLADVSQRMVNGMLGIITERLVDLNGDE